MKRILLTLIVIGLHTFAACYVRSDEQVVTVELDVSETPELRPWGENARKTLLEWYPRICNLLPTKGFVASDEVHLRIRESDKGVAGTAGNKIGIFETAIVVRIEDEPGELARVTRRFKDANVNLNSVRIIRRGDGKSFVAIGAEKIAEATALVKDLIIS